MTALGWGTSRRSFFLAFFIACGNFPCNLKRYKNRSTDQCQQNCNIRKTHGPHPLSALGHPGSGQLFKKPAIPGTWVPASGLPPAFWTQRLRRLCGRLTILYHEFRHAATRAKSLLRKTCQNPLTPPRCCGKMILR